MSRRKRGHSRGGRRRCRAGVPIRVNYAKSDAQRSRVSVGSVKGLDSSQGFQRVERFVRRIIGHYSLPSKTNEIWF
jgi:hypothetical protein